MKITIDPFKIIFIIVAVILCSIGLVSWWILLLFAIYSIDLEFTFSV